VSGTHEFPSHAPAPPEVAPVPVLALEYAPPSPATARQRIWRRIARVCLVAAWLTCVIALACITVRTESVIISGAVICALGLLCLVGGLLTRERLTVVVGAGHCAICVLFVVLVNALRWSPRDAHTPFLVMGTIYTIAIAVPTAMIFVRKNETLPG
jgi:hypothetical protein